MKIKIITYLLVVLLVANSCQDDDKFLSEATPSVFAANEPKSNDELYSLVLGNFFAFMGAGQTGAPFDGIVSYPVMASGEMDMLTLDGDYARGNMDHWFTRQNTDIDIYTTQFFTHTHYVTNQCGVVLNQVGKFEEKKALEPLIEGQTRFLKALTNFAGVTAFAPPYGKDNKAKAIVLYDENSLSKGPKDLRSRNTVEEVYAAIIKDLEIAIAKLPSTWTSGNDPAMAKYKILPYKAAAQFLLARVYFNMGKENWSKALPYINSVLADQQYALETDPRNAYDLKKNVVPGKETIWCLSSEWWTWLDPTFIWHSFNYDLTSNTWDYHGTGRMYPISEEMLKYVGWNDTIEAKKDQRYNRNFIRFEAGKDPLTIYKSLTKPYVWPRKFGVSYRSSIQMMRLAEMYLDKAIILFNSGDKAGAAAALKVIRDRAGLPEIKAADLTEEIIHKERAKEMMYEGDWLRYLQTQRKQIAPGKNPIAWDDPSLILPVPLDEKTYNPNI